MGIGTQVVAATGIAAGMIGVSAAGMSLAQRLPNTPTGNHNRAGTYLGSALAGAAGVLSGVGALVGLHQLMAPLPTRSLGLSTAAIGVAFLTLAAGVVAGTGLVGALTSRPDFLTGPSGFPTNPPWAN